MKHKSTRLDEKLFKERYEKERERERGRWGLVSDTAASIHA